MIVHNRSIYNSTMSHGGRGRCSVLMLPGFVYYLAFPNGTLKVGWTSNLHSRMLGHRSWYGRFEVIGIVPTLSSDEYLAHARFDPYRVGGKCGDRRRPELYRPPTDVLEALRAELAESLAQHLESHGRHADGYYPAGSARKYRKHPSPWRRHPGPWCADHESGDREVSPQNIERVT